MKLCLHYSFGRRAFSLLELAIALMITGMVAGMAMKLTATTDRNECYAASKAQVEKIKQAIDRFALSNRRFPLPARRYVGTDSPLYGKEVKPGEIAQLDSVTTDGKTAVFGTVPYAALGLTMDDAIDCWGNRLTYVVTKDLTDVTKFSNDTDGAITISVAQNARIATQNPPTPDGFGYAVIVHGEDQLGAVKANWSDYTANTHAKRKWCDADGTLKTPNCLASNANLMGAPFNNGDNPATYFDDVIIWRGKPWRAEAAVTTGKAYCWGRGRSDLGDGNSAPHTNNIPVAVLPPVGSTTAIKFQSIVLGPDSTCGLDGDGTIWCWGSGDTLGSNIMPPRSNRPLAVGGVDLYGQPLKFKLLKASSRSFCGLTKHTNSALDGKIYCWGKIFGNSGILNSPVPYATAYTETFKDFVMANEAICGLITGNAVMCLGSNNKGLLGNSSVPYWFSSLVDPYAGSHYYRETPVLAANGLQKLYTPLGGDGTRICSTAGLGGRSMCWGVGGVYSLLGNGVISNVAGGWNTASATPVEIVGPDFTTLSLGDFSSCGIAVTTGKTYCWGSGGGDDLGSLPTGNSRAGLLGLGVSGNRVDATIEVAGNHQFRKIYAFGYCQDINGANDCLPNCAIDDQNKAWCWGTHPTALGSPGPSTSLAPRAVAGGLNFAALYSRSVYDSLPFLDGNFICGLTTEGKSYCWGEQPEGNFGNKSLGSTNNNTPQATFGPDGTLAGALKFKELAIIKTRVCGIALD